MTHEIRKWKLDQLNLHDLGNTIQISGIIYSDEEVVYLCMLPNEELDGKQLRLLDLSQEDWKKVVQQTDLMETEVLAKSADGTLAKVIIRKSTRTIEQNTSWAVYRRDQYHCRYCGRSDVPLTVDHLILWEEGGPSTEENLMTCCRRCNKARGNMQYAEWLASKFYKDFSRDLQPNFRRANERIIEEGLLDKIPRRYQQRGR